MHSKFLTPTKICWRNCDSSDCSSLYTNPWDLSLNWKLKAHIHSEQVLRVHSFRPRAWCHNKIEVDYQGRIIIRNLVVAFLNSRDGCGHQKVEGGIRHALLKFTIDRMFIFKINWNSHRDRFFLSTKKKRVHSIHNYCTWNK